ncbi:cutinase transcription factor 1 [Fusarium denticulatum]|uniref:Cutinase transcription factor 1 n=1 Tax=Fusarium denticulatum TaxID=48507 RepID=A0A8H5WTA5_9HYPO|nr:cutinase transcription factor 1 [Fusarium denticulatum]
MTQVSVSSTPSVFATFVRGGTSKALFFHEKDIPAPGEARDKFLIRVMGSPDPSQIDGMGGARIVTSKVAIIRPSERPDADVDYTFAQIGLGEAEVSYDGNCGNISSGVGPFSINERLLKTNDWKDGRRVVRIYNTGKDAVLVAHVHVDKSTGRALEKGDYAISGCPGTGAPILMDYSKTASPKNVLPTGNVIDQLDCTFGTVKATFCEVGNPIVFVTADSLGIKGSEVVSAIDSNKDLIARVREIRGRMAMKLGKCSDWTQVDKQSPMLPMVALVSKSTSTEGHIQSRLFLDNRCHPSMAGTGGVCTAATSRVTGSVVNWLLTAEALKSCQLVIQHPAGHLPIQVHPNNVVDAQFSAYYQTAASWLYGDAQGWAIYDHLNDPAVHSLCDKITIEGKRLPNDLITTMIVTARGGITQEMTLERPKWQEPERPPQNAEVMQKFRSLAILVLGNKKTEKELEWAGREGRVLGFTEKQCIHPLQVDVVHRAFEPSEASIWWAVRVRDGDEEARSKGKGAWKLDGKMIDAPVAKRALALIERATLCGIDLSKFEKLLEHIVSGPSVPENNEAPLQTVTLSISQENNSNDSTIEISARSPSPSTDSAALPTLFFGESNFLTLVPGGPRQSKSQDDQGKQPSRLVFPINQTPQSALEGDSPASIEHLSPGTTRYLRDEGALTTPSLHACIPALEAYFTWFHPCFPILDRSDFVRKLALSQVSYILLHSMLFVGATYCDEATITSMGFSSRTQAKSLLYTRARLLFHADWERDQITLIQSLFLMSFWRGGPSDVRDVRYWLGVAIGMAESYGLHRTTRFVTRDAQKARLRRRIWWSIYVRERQASASLGLPSRIRDNDCDVEPLSESDLESDIETQDGLQFGSCKPEHKTYAVNMAKLARILGQVIDLNFAPGRKPSTPEQLRDIDDALQQWKVRLPDEINQGVEDGTASVWGHLLHLAYKYVMLW